RSPRTPSTSSTSEPGIPMTNPKTERPAAGGSSPARLAPLDVRPGLAQRAGRLPILTTVVWFTVVVMGFLLLYPLVVLVRYVFFPDGSPELGAIVETFRDPGLARVLLNTVAVVLVAVPISVVVGGVLAW